MSETETYTETMAESVHGGSSGVVMSRIRELRGIMRTSETRVADYVLAHPQEVVHLKVDGLARRSGVSTTSVLRFCHALGLEGFTQFRTMLAVELNPLAYPETAPDEDPFASLVRSVFHADMQAIAQTLDLLDLAELRRAVERMAAARRIDIYSIGLSAPVALDAASRFIRIGLDARAVTDAHMMAISAALLDSRDCALLISHSGRSPETIHAAELAHAAGAHVTGLASYPNTPLLAHCDTSLVTAVSETRFRVQAMASRIAHLTVIDALYTALAAERSELSSERLRLTNEIIERKRL